ncbi:MAG: 5-(carboxyamino)imidazole ribonucleotide synthase [Roseinatronobacter sp.]
MSDPMAPGSRIGILGGGQLARMLSVAASRLGYQCHIYDPSDSPPAGDVSAAVTTAAWTDRTALAAFAADVAVITYEFENIPTDTLDVLADLRPIWPGRQALAVSQDRLTEKQFLRDLGLRTAAFAPVADADELARALAQIGTPALLKTRRMGYDGKGQARIDTPDAAAPALAAMAGARAILEGFVPFEFEVSVIAARGLNGDVAAYDPGQNLHKQGILRETRVPAPLRASARSDAVLLAAKILNALDYVGVLGVELFVTEHGLIVNEIAPRVHNSGHWTQNGCAVDQFEQHIRAITGLPLGDGTRHADVVMENLIGDDMDRLPEMLRSRDVAVHLYGKQEVRAGRKMGHVNRIQR